MLPLLFVGLFVSCCPTVHSRAESRTSMTSVTTIEEINMGFELAILAGQEAMLEESSEEGINLVPSSHLLRQV